MTIKIKITLIKLAKIIFILIIALILFCLLAILYVYYYSNPKILSADDVDITKVAIVFGAKTNSDGTLSEALQNRVDTAIDLYKNGKVEKLLFTGDNSRKDYDEVTNMKNYAIDNEINPNDIKLDYAGFRTYDSCYRAKEIFGLKDAVLISQKYHLYRAIYECNRLGIESIGVAADDFTGSKIIESKTRELFAIIQAFIEINITHPRPKFLGEFGGI